MSGLRHVVLFRWAEGTTTGQQEEVAERLTELLGRLPMVGSFSLGPNAKVSPGGFDLAVVVDFDGAADYLAYRDDPEHRALVDGTIVPLLGDRAAVQYEL